MWINITKDIFDNSDFKGLNYLYQILSYNLTASTRPRYNIVVNTEKVKETDNFKKLNSYEKNLVEFLDFELSNYITTSEIPYKITSKKGKLNYNIEEAILFLSQPVSIILENSKNDAEFIIAIIKNFGNKDGYNKAKEHLDNAWLQFENAGGCTNIPNFLEGFFRQFKDIGTKNNRNLYDYFRGIVIFDSDKEFQNQAIKNDHVKLLGKLLELGFDVSGIIDVNKKILNINKNFHILEKRMMENYLPKEIFLEISRQMNTQNNQELKDWLAAYLSLTDNEQIDFINIPDGFPPSENKFENGNRKNVSNDVLNLFQMQITHINFKKLDVGFNFKGFDDKGKLNTGKEFKVKNELPKWFKKELINKKNLEERDRNSELQRILDKITALL